jgi:hypothetical protein
MGRVKPLQGIQPLRSTLLHRSVPNVVQLHMQNFGKLD